MDRRQRVRTTSYGVAIAFLGAVAYPCWWPHGTDSFPLSTFPMFAKPRPVRASVSTVLGVDADGRRTTLSPNIIGGSQWVNLSVRRVNTTIRKGRRASEKLCHDIAARMEDAAPPGVVQLEVVTETFDSLEYFDTTQAQPKAGAKPLKRRVHAVCPSPK